MPSGPAAWLTRWLTRLNVLLTSATEKESPQSLVAGRIGGTVLSSECAKKLFNLSVSKISMSATGLVIFFVIRD